MGYSPWGHKESDTTEVTWHACMHNAGDTGDVGSIPGLGRSLGGKNGYLLKYSCLGNPSGRWNLVGYSPWGRKELDTTERLSTLARIL